MICAPIREHLFFYTNGVKGNMAGNILDVGVRFHATQSEIDKMLKKVESAFSEIDISSSFGKEFEKTYKRMLQL